VRYFPLFADMADQTVFVSGAGEAAASKLRLLLKTPARIVVFGTEPIEEILEWQQMGLIELIARPLHDDDIDTCLLFYAANEDESENERVLTFARSKASLVNAVDDPDRSQFITPALVDRGPVTVAIGTEGTAPVLARRIKAAVEALLPAAIGGIAMASGRFRHHVAKLGDGRARRCFWEKVFPPDDPFSHARKDLPQFNAFLKNAFEGSGDHARPNGHVIFVGAGPGDPDLLTHRARREIDRADVVLHDRLVPDAIVELARREAKVLNVGKRAYGGGWTQDAINRLMIDHAMQGCRVVRLKSGDPVMFGRLDEEIDALAASGTAYEIVPGIPSASAAAATIGRSLTRRQRNSSLRFATGHDLNGYSELDWRELAGSGSVTVIYMGRESARFIRGRMLMHGADAGMPVVVVANASRADEVTIATTIGALPEDIRAAAPAGPMIMLLGLSAGAAKGQHRLGLTMEQV